MTEMNKNEHCKTESPTTCLICLQRSTSQNFHILLFYCSADILNIEHTPWISTPGFPRYYCSDEILNIEHTPWISTPGFPRYYCSDEILNIEHTPWISTPGFPRYYCSDEILNIQHTPWISTPGFPRYYCSDEILNIQHTPWISTPGFQSIPNLFTYYPPERIQMQSSLITLITLIRSEMDPKP